MSRHNHHHHYHYNRHFPGAVFGLGMITFGILALLSSQNILIDRNPWDFWPVILIIMGLGSLLYRRIFGALILFAIGGFFLAKNFVPGFTIQIWPIIIILVGLKILSDVFYRPFWHRFRGPNVNTISEDFFDISSHLTDGFYTINSRDLKGGKMNVLMGDLKVDLKSADFTGDSLTLNVSVLMGDMHLIIPNTWEIDMQGTSFLGSFGDHTFHDYNINGSRKKRLIIKGSVTMGDLKVMN